MEENRNDEKKNVKLSKSARRAIARIAVKQNIIERLRNKDYLSSHIIVSAVNATRAEYWLQSIPHIKLDDIAVYCQLDVSMLVNPDATDTDEQLLVMDYDLMASIGGNYTFCDFLCFARKNRKNEYHIERANSTVLGEIPIYAITSSTGHCAGPSLTYDKIWQDLSDICGCDLYILPFDNRCLYVIPTVGVDEDKLLDIISPLAEYVGLSYLSKGLRLYDRVQAQIFLIGEIE